MSPRNIPAAGNKEIGKNCGGKGISGRLGICDDADSTARGKIDHLLRFSNQIADPSGLPIIQNQTVQRILQTGRSGKNRGGCKGDDGKQAVRRKSIGLSAGQQEDLLVGTDDISTDALPVGLQQVLHQRQSVVKTSLQGIADNDLPIALLKAILHCKLGIGFVFIGTVADDPAGGREFFQIFWNCRIKIADGKLRG